MQLYNQISAQNKTRTRSVKRRRRKQKVLDVELPLDELEDHKYSFRDRLRTAEVEDAENAE